MKAKQQVRVAFAALDPYIQQNIIEATEKTMSGREYVQWGDRNRYPGYLFELYKGAPTLRSVIDGSVDYVCGNKVQAAFYPHDGYMNSERQTAAELVHDLGLSWFMYGGFAIEVIRDRAGDIAELYQMDLRYLRSSKNNDVFWYSEDWEDNSSATKTVMRPKFMPEATELAASILYVKNTSMQTYPLPLYSDAVKACEIERCIDTYNLNTVKNGFSGSTIIEFPGPAPEDEQKKEIERDVNEKFGGPENGGRIMLVWNNGGTERIKTTPIAEKDVATKYETLVKNSRQKIFTAFRANPNLFGIPTENLGFSSEEYEAAFKLYNRTQIIPVQQKICEAVGKVFGNPDYLKIEPFTLE